MKVKNLTCASWRKGIAKFALFAWKIGEMCRSDPKIVQICVNVAFNLLKVLPMDGRTNQPMDMGRCWGWLHISKEQWTVFNMIQCIRNCVFLKFVCLRIPELKWDKRSATGWWRLRIADRWWDQQRAGAAADTNLTGHQFNWRQLPALSNTGTSGPQMRLPIGGSSTVYQHNSHCRGMALLPGALDWHLDLINVILRHKNDITLISRNTEIFC